MESSIVVFTFDGCIYVCVSACSKTKTLSRTIWKINSQIMMKMVSCSPLLLLCVIDGNQSLMVLNLCVLLHCFFMLPRSYRSFVMRESVNFTYSYVFTQWESAEHTRWVHAYLVWHVNFNGCRANSMLFSTFFRIIVEESNVSNVTRVVGKQKRQFHSICPPINRTANAYSVQCTLSSV